MLRKVKKNNKHSYHWDFFLCSKISNLCRLIFLELNKSPLAPWNTAYDFKNGHGARPYLVAAVEAEFEGGCLLFW